MNLKDLKLQFQYINGCKFNDLDFTQLNKRYASLTEDPSIASIDLYADSNGVEVLDGVVGQYQPGTNGRWFRLVKNGATKLVVGNLLQGPAYDSQFTNMAVLAAAIQTSGVQSVTVTLGTTTVNQNDFLGGSISVYTTPDLCSDYVITGHTTGTSGQNITVYLDRYLRTAWTTSTKVNMKRNPWSGVIQCIATTPTNMPVGFAPYATLASVVGTTSTIGTPQYGWAQTHGVTCALSDGSSILTQSTVSDGSGTAGAVQLHPFSGNATAVGTALQPGASGHGIEIFASID